ncbi:MAG: NAD(P)-dependent oxidoreductase [Polynucleobacter sp.]|uniref:NAD-dependent epimerase/dehydratase family protein n=1 Tax=Polynucleobacter sp. TaxID=2029855 RepID=UPI0027159797|nr:NAD(P)-dependent oxidoreductase [Polynucleobacter sp.]MDO8714688.1 NAD(P)-dependent oxidoreductase [Polynucleobacter sp.]
MIKVLITGATGFVGRQILNSFSGEEVNLLPVVRLGKEDSVSSLPNVERTISSPDIFKETESWWAEQCRDIDVVIHAAWYTEPGKYLQSELNMICMVGSLNLARGAAIAGVKRFIGIGTCFEYDLDSGVLSVETPIKPLTPYAGAKAALYLSLSQWLPTQAVQLAWCRLFYLFGDGEDDRRFVPYLRKKLENGEMAELTSGTQIRDFLDVREAGRKIASVALGTQIGPINICSGIPITVRQFAEKIADEYGRRDLLDFGKRADNLIDPTCVIGIPNI